MYVELGKIINEYSLNYSLDFTKSVLVNIDNMRNIVNKSSLNCKLKIDLLYRRAYVDFFYYNTDLGKDIINEFEMNGYKVIDHCITYDKYIPIEAVTYDYTKSILVNSDLFESEDIGITKFKIYLNSSIFSVYCDGNHPNMNDGRFCIDSNILTLPLNFENVNNYVKPILGFINMDYAYNNKSLHKVKEILINAGIK